MASARSYEIRLFDRTLVEFTIEDGLFGPEVTVDDFDESASALMYYAAVSYSKLRA